MDVWVAILHFSVRFLFFTNVLKRESCSTVISPPLPPNPKHIIVYLLKRKFKKRRGKQSSILEIVL